MTNYDFQNSLGPHRDHEAEQPEKCPDNMKPESVVDHSRPKKVMTCKEYRKQYRECPVYRPEHVRECDVTVIGKRGRIQTVSYSQYVRMME